MYRKEDVLRKLNADNYYIDVRALDNFITEWQIDPIYEAKDGKYGEDGSETLDAFKAKEAEDKTASTFSNSFGDLKKNIEYLIGMERQSGSMDLIPPLYVSRMLNVPLEKVKKVMGYLEK